MSAYDKLVYVGCDAAQSGTFQGELILDTANKGDINGDGKVSYIMIQAILRTLTPSCAPSTLSRPSPMPVLRWSSWISSGATGTVIAARRLLRAALAKFGDQIEVIFCNNDDMAIGALQAIQAAGPQGE